MNTVTEEEGTQKDKKEVQELCSVAKKATKNQDAAIILRRIALFSEGKHTYTRFTFDG